MSKGLDDAGLSRQLPNTAETVVTVRGARRNAAEFGLAQNAPAAGIKHDDGKPAMHLIPPEALDAMAEVLGFGAKKYEPRNWERGLSYSRVFAAATRHLWAWWRGAGHDPETNFSHLDHALTCVAFLVAYERRKMGSFDDRPENSA